MTDMTQKLPLELLAEILGHVSVPEVLRFKQVRGQPLVRGNTYWTQLVFVGQPRLS